MNEMAKLAGFEHVQHLSIPLPGEASQEIFHECDDDDERVWMPLADNVWIRPLLFNVVQGAWCNIVKAEGEGVVGRHRHPAPVLGYTLEGAWGYLEGDWISRPGDFVYEPAGETHTLVVHPEAGHMKTLFHNMGPILYVDENGDQIGYEDVFTRIAAYKKHYAGNGLGADYVDRLCR